MPASPRASTTPAQETPARARLVLATLLISAVVCNVNYAAAGVALPDIGLAFDATQIQLNLVALGTGLGLAMSVLYFGAIADRYGRKQLLLTGMVLTIVASVISAYAPSIEILIGARVFTGLAAGMAYPTTLSLISALWADGPKRTKAIALWASVGGMASVAGGMLSGAILAVATWHESFLLSIPIAVVAIVLILTVIPSHVAESSEPVDHLGGALSVVGIGSLVLGIGLVFAPGYLTTGIVLFASAVAFIAAFLWRQAKARHPLYDLTVARRRLFWVPAFAGMIAFGALIGAMFVGQQFMQNVLAYTPLEAGVAVVPAAVGLISMAPIAARVVLRSGTRASMLIGYALIVLAFGTMLAWREDAPYVLIGLAYLLIGSGASFVLTASSRSLTSTTPVRRVGMASATSDLQSDLGGSVMQAFLGAVLAVGFAAAFARHIAESPQAGQVSAEVTMALQASYASAVHVASQYPSLQDAIIEAARQSLVSGALAAYLIGGIAIVVGAVVVWLGIPGHRRELELRETYRQG